MANLKKRGSTFYAQFYLGGKQRRVCLGTDSYQIAKEKLRQLESSMARDEGLGLSLDKAMLQDVLSKKL